MSTEGVKGSEEGYTVGQKVIVDVGALTNVPSEIYEVNPTTRKVKVNLLLFGRTVQSGLDIDFNDIRKA